MGGLCGNGQAAHERPRRGCAGRVTSSGSGTDWTYAETIVHKPTAHTHGTDPAAGGRRGRSPGPRAPKHRVVGGRYEVESLLGVGGMAEVVLARDSALGRRVALKLLAPALVADPVFVERFRREATAIAALSHANVVVIYEHGVAEGQPFIAMEYVPGRTVKQIITAGAPLPPAVAVNYACQALAGLAAAHATGIVHRDIKPQNLLVREDDTLKVADFGVARSAQDTVMTQHGSVIGTADYIAPEQAPGSSGGGRLGSLLPGSGAVRDAHGPLAVHR